MVWVRVDDNWDPHIGPPTFGGSKGVPAKICIFIIKEGSWTMVGGPPIEPRGEKILDQSFYRGPSGGGIRGPVGGGSATPPPTSA